MAAVSVRSDARARARARRIRRYAKGLELLGGEAAFRARRRSPPRGADAGGGAGRSRTPGSSTSRGPSAGESRRGNRAAGAARRSTGRRLRPHCSQALTATARQCAAFDCGLGRIEAHHAALAQHRNDARHAELRGLLHDEIHPVAARHALHQGDCERRFAVDRRGPRPPPRVHASPAHALDGGGEFAAVPGEQHQRIAAARAQHLGQVRGGRGRAARRRFREPRARPST